MCRRRRRPPGPAPPRDGIDRASGRLGPPDGSDRRTAPDPGTPSLGRGENEEQENHAAMAGQQPADSSRQLRKVLIANRGEIAVRVARACRDAGLGQRRRLRRPRPRRAARARRRGVRARRRDARPRPTSTPPSSSTSRGAAGADAVHPGYGFLSENADFAQAVIDAGLTWIGPPPDGHRRPGRQGRPRGTSPQRAGAPLVPGTADPVADADEVVAFANEHGLPIAIKAAYGGGGRGLKVARTIGGDPRAVRRPPSARRSRRSAAASASSSATSTTRATSRPSAWPTSTATSSWCPPATARCSAATRSSSRRRRRRS